MAIETENPPRSRPIKPLRGGAKKKKKAEPRLRCASCRKPLKGTDEDTHWVPGVGKALCFHCTGFIGKVATGVGNVLQSLITGGRRSG